MTTVDATELLFSYGTLQLEPVQMALFGRSLVGTPDVLPGFKQTLLEIDDEATVRMSGKTHHAMAEFSGNPSDAIRGTAFELTLAEVESADKYEVAAYKRVAVTLGSGRRAWAYVDARCTPGNA
jgi:gamma-glutamyl AIG2-like cyclotransferase